MVSKRPASPPRAGISFACRAKDAVIRRRRAGAATPPPARLSTNHCARAFSAHHVPLHDVVDHCIHAHREEKLRRQSPALRSARRIDFFFSPPELPTPRSSLRGPYCATVPAPERRRRGAVFSARSFHNHRSKLAANPASCISQRRPAQVSLPSIERTGVI